MIPNVIKPAVINFLGPSLSFSSVTLVQNIATNTTGSMLDDYIIVTTGNEVCWMANNEKNVAEIAANPVKAAFLWGMYTG